MATGTGSSNIAGSIIASFDGFVIVTPEYNHSTSGVLKNALDFLFAEWNKKSVGYGSVGGARAVESLRLIVANLMADVCATVSLSLATDFVNYSQFTPGAHQEAALNTVLSHFAHHSLTSVPVARLTTRHVDKRISPAIEATVCRAIPDLVVMSVSSGFCPGESNRAGRIDR
ncbi:NADPH-dependent FMN reductase [Actinoplanes sp. M2I2]|uniref:NADPH-dependent FMN reductase n=1 Tax=Actinoplanes sp. M2I2 TaxID=1734444 RepID=UPI0027E180E2|nr:NADPH-dependent FMN reductase [Actinoplanes sp. M2I2]